MPKNVTKKLLLKISASSDFKTPKSDSDDYTSKILARLEASTALNSSSMKRLERSLQNVK